MNLQESMKKTVEHGINDITKEGEKVSAELGEKKELPLKELKEVVKGFSGYADDKLVRLKHKVQQAIHTQQNQERAKKAHELASKAGNTVGKGVFGLGKGIGAFAGMAKPFFKGINDGYKG